MGEVALGGFVLICLGAGSSEGDWRVGTSGV